MRALAAGMAANARAARPYPWAMCPSSPAVWRTFRRRGGGHHIAPGSPATITWVTCNPEDDFSCPLGQASSSLS
jgi:hypothetical protein